MHINDDMVRRFFNRQCSEEEARLVADWLKDHPDIAEPYFTESDWQDDTGEQAPTAGWDAIWNALRRNIRRSRIKRITYSLTACACIMLLCIWISKPDKPVGQLSHTQPKLISDSFALSNDGDTSLTYILPDGTNVSLSPHSSISYSRSQWKMARQVIMDGEVVFKVARDQTRPFIVYCENLSVQALGTVFSVRRLSGDNNLKVRLYKGKIVVKPVRRNGKEVLHQFTNYLLPGQELLIPLSTYVPRQYYFLQSKDGNLWANARPKHHTREVKISGWYEFTSQPLADVFTTLEILHGVEIHYNRATLENLFFIGRFGLEDAIEDVLGTIALLNDLTVTKRSDNKYYVAKKG